MASNAWFIPTVIAIICAGIAFKNSINIYQFFVLISCGLEQLFQWKKLLINKKSLIVNSILTNIHYFV